MGAALVTGASSGIGLAIALELAQSGRKVFAIARGTRGLNALRTAHAAITPIALDVTDREAVEATLDGLEIDVLVNNAGMMPPLGNFADMAMADIDTALEVNLSAAIALTRLVVPQMRARGRGDILFTGSAAGHGAYPNMAVYAATKGGIASFAQGLRADLSPFGIRVTEIVPGRVERGCTSISWTNRRGRRCMPARPCSPRMWPVWSAQCWSCRNGPRCRALTSCPRTPAPPRKDS